MWMFSGFRPNSPATPPLGDRHALARRVEIEFVAVPARHHRVGLEGIVVLRRGFDHRLGRLGRIGQAERDVAGSGLGRHAGADRLRLKRGAVEPDRRRLDVVSRRQQRHAFLRGLERLRDHHGDRLVGIADAIVLKEIELEGEPARIVVRMLKELRRVPGRHDFDHAGMRLGGIDVHGHDAALGDAGDAQHGM